MDIKLVLPKTTVLIEPGARFFFLAGPVSGGGDWQAEAIREIATAAPKSYVVCPCRYKPDHPLFPLSFKGVSEQVWADNGFLPFTSQTLWERLYLETASEQGSIIFWLGRESKTDPRPPDTGPYARDTYGELGEWRARMYYDSAHVVIGADPEFPGLSVIRKNFDAMLGSSFTIHETIRDTVRAATTLSKKR